MCFLLSGTRMIVAVFLWGMAYNERNDERIERMTTLIMGSFFVVALLAFLAALWLAYAEKQEILAKTSKIAAAVPTTPTVTVPVSVTTEKNTFPQLTLQNTLLPIVSNGQLYELIYELRALHTQAHEIDKRLLIVTTLVEQLQKTSSYNAVREEVAV